MVNLSSPFLTPIFARKQKHIKKSDLVSHIVLEQRVYSMKKEEDSREEGKELVVRERLGEEEVEVVAEVMREIKEDTEEEVIEETELGAKELGATEHGATDQELEKDLEPILKENMGK
jgi:hypothetical protein